MLLEVRVRFAEEPTLVCLAGVRLDDVDAGEGLLHAGGELGEALLHAERALHQQPAGPLHDEEGHRVDGERGDGQARIDREHDGEAVDVVDGRVDEVEDARAEEHADRRHVVHQPGHEVPGVALLVEGER